MLLRTTLLFVSMLALAGMPVAGWSQGQGGTAAVERALATPTPAAAPTGAVYLTLVNRGKAADRLIGAATPRAKRVEIHAMSMAGDVMRMREVEAIEIKPGEKIAMTPGSGYHVMLVDLTAPLKSGDRFPMILRFEKAGEVKVEVMVQAPAKPAAKGGSSHSMPMH